VTFSQMLAFGDCFSVNQHIMAATALVTPEKAKLEEQVLHACKYGLSADVSRLLEAGARLNDTR
jgi:hypothetical protein